jgi:hypothetical protein
LARRSRHGTGRRQPHEHFAWALGHVMLREATPCAPDLRIAEQG